MFCMACSCSCKQKSIKMKNKNASSNHACMHGSNATKERKKEIDREREREMRTITTGKCSGGWRTSWSMALGKIGNKTKEINSKTSAEKLWINTCVVYSYLKNNNQWIYIFFLREKKN